MAKRKAKAAAADETPTVVKRKRDTRSGRIVRRTLCMANVADAVGPIERGCEIYGMTKGKWSLVDLIEHCLAYTGPADCVLSTWTAAGADISFANRFLAEQRLLSLRAIVDFSFPSRQPAYCAAMVEAFGRDCIRVTKNHAKFVLLTNAEWNLAIRTSMNLNENRRCENFEISDCPELAGYLREFVDGLWRDQSAEQAFESGPSELCRQFEFQWGDDGSGAGGSDEAAKRYFGDGPADVDLRRVGVSRRC